MDKKQQDIAYFISFCIEQYKNAKGLSGEEVMQEFSKYGVLEYLHDFFDVLHTQSYQWLLANIDQKERGHKMKIYHGSIEQICSPEIREPNRRLDYGAGFYATTSYEQAERWVQRKMRESKTCKGYVNIYEFDKQAMYTLKTLSFPTPTAEWIDFVMLNRTKQGYTHDYDIVYGPVANDHVYAALALYEGHVLSKQALISELQTYKLVDQYLFHTERSLDSITFMEAKEIKS